MKKILFFGDSITDCERDYSAPMGSEPAYGKGYVRYIATRLFLEYGEAYQVINQGINGNRVIDLKKRLDQDVLNYEPEYVVIMIGINDVWRYYDSHTQSIEQVDLEKFVKVYRAIIETLTERNCDVILVSPYFLELNKEDPMRKQMEMYIDAVKNLAKQYQLLFIDVQAAFDKFLNQYSSYAISWDRIHMNYRGNTYLGMTLYRPLMAHIHK